MQAIVVETTKHTIVRTTPLGKIIALLTTQTDARKPAVKPKLEYAPTTKKTVARADNTPQYAIFLEFFNCHNPFLSTEALTTIATHICKAYIATATTRASTVTGSSAIVINRA